MIRQCRNCGEVNQRQQPYCAACEYMSPREAAVRLQVSRPTYYRWVKEGRIHPKRIGVKKRLVLRAEVDALLA